MTRQGCPAEFRRRVLELVASPGPGRTLTVVEDGASCGNYQVVHGDSLNNVRVSLERNVTMSGN
jgi:hypothetical protein